MYQVIIVDDEPRILEGIIHLFPWNNFGFEVVASLPMGKKPWNISMPTHRWTSL